MQKSMRRQRKKDFQDMSWPLTLSSVMAAILQEEPFTLRSYYYFEESSGHRGGVGTDEGQQPNQRQGMENKSRKGWEETTKGRPLVNQNKGNSVGRGKEEKVRSWILTASILDKTFDIFCIKKVWRVQSPLTAV